MWHWPGGGCGVRESSRWRGRRVFRLLTGEGPLAEAARRYVAEDFTRELEAWMDRVEAGGDPLPLLETLEAATRSILEEPKPPAAAP